MTYAENWKRYLELEGQRDRAAAELQAANANALIAYGQPNQPQAENLAVQKRVEFEVASNALTSFEANLQATAPEQLQKIQDGRDPSGIVEQSKGYLQSDIAKTDAEVAKAVLEVVIDNPAPIGIGDIAESAKIVWEHGADWAKAQVAHGLDFVKAQLAPAEQELNNVAVQQVKDEPQPMLNQKIENATPEEISKADQATEKQKQLDDLKEKHDQQIKAQEESLQKFKESQADKSPEVQAKQDEMAEKLRADLAEKQAREMQAAREAEIRAQMLENQRDMLR